MKLKQTSLILFSVTSIILSSLFIQSCNSDKDYEQISPSLTEADVLVASREFQEFQKNTESFAKKFRKKHMNLSKSDRKKFVYFFSKLADPNIENSEELYKKANSIIGIDIEREFNKIR